MKPVATQEYEVTGNMRGRKVALSIRPEDMRKIMYNLTNLYKNSALAVAREYSSNAWDAQQEAGYKGPIEVQTPSPFNRFFVVRDRGTGMSPETLERVYSSYGYSTKENTNQQVGMLGYGCKAALAYTEQFSIVSVHNGIKTFAVMKREADGSGSLDGIKSVATDEPNGTEIKVPINNVNEFNKYAEWLFQYWEPGSVLVNGQAPKQFKGDPLGDDMWVVQGQSYIIMGNVPYPVHIPVPGLNYQSGIVARVPIGTVQPAPPRESLVEDDNTNRVLINLGNKAAAILLAAAQRNVDDADDRAEAFERAQSWRGKGIRGNLTYKGVPVPATFHVDGIEYRIGSRSNWGGNRKRQLNISTGGYYERKLYVTDYDKDTIEPHHKAKARLYINENSLSYGTVVFVTEKNVGDGWTNPPQVDWLTVKATKKTRTKQSYVAGYSIPVQIWDKTWVDAKGVDPKTSCILTTPADNLSGLTLQTCWPDKTIVLLARNRWDKFKREHDDVLEVGEAFDADFKSLVDSLTDYDKMVLTGDRYYKRFAEAVKGKSIEDPEFAKLMRALVDDKPSDTVRRVHAMNKLAPYIGKVAPDITVDEVTSRYPLIDWSGEHIDHAITYINAVYRSENE